MESQFPTRTPLRLGASHPGDAGGQLRCQQAVVGRLDREFADGGDPDID